MSKQLRVLHVLGELKPSGAETMLVSAASMFRAHGVSADVLVTGQQEGVFAERFRQAGYRLLHLPFARSPSFFTAERALMAAGNYDVIHLHTEQANFWHGLMARSTRPKVLLRTVHNSFAFDGNLQWRRGWQRRMLNHLGIQHVAISDSVRNTESVRYRIPTQLIWNWYDSNRFTVTTAETREEARAAFGIELGRFVIASIGNCSDVKNHGAVIQALAQLPPERRPIYLHAGLEQDGHSERLLATSLGVADSIRFLGPLNDVLPLLRAADAYVMPSLFEGFGIAAIEALATGLPALFSDVDGLRDFREDFPGLVYTGTKVEDVRQGLEHLIALPEAERESIRRLYPQMARRRFGMERGVDEYMSLYRRGKLSPALQANAVVGSGQ